MILQAQNGMLYNLVRYPNAQPAVQAKGLQISLTRGPGLDKAGARDRNPFHRASSMYNQQSEFRRALQRFPSLVNVDIVTKPLEYTTASSLYRRDLLQLQGRCI